ncbi:MAG: dockerin type I domain-containing protein [Oscillospiraceae bacterium]|nr:dockerin type I domain-containing protein [Oscillospiraceae bacterium]
MAKIAKKIISIILAAVIIITSVTAITPDNPFRIGDVDGNGTIEISDVLEILKYMAKMNNTITGHGKEAEADINQDGEIDLWDVMAIIAFLSKFTTESEMGNYINEKIRDLKPFNLQFEVDAKAGIIRYITEDEIPGNDEIIYIQDLKIQIENGYIASRPKQTLVEEWSITISPGTSVEKGDFEAIAFLNVCFPAGGVIMTQSFTGGVKAAHSIVISGTVNYQPIYFSGLPVIGCEDEGCCLNPIRETGDVDGDGVVAINDALEILKYLAGMSSKIETSDFAFNAAKITGGETPAIADVLEILKHLAGMTSVLNYQVSESSDNN